MIARSGSTEGRSGRVMSPAPSCLRVVREDPREVRREPVAERLTGDEPVIAEEATGALRAELGILAEPAERDEAAALLTSASPQRLQ